jgi:hypothetical protein
MTRMRARRAVGVATVAAWFGAALLAGPASATSPGANGRIAYTGSDYTIHTVLPTGYGDEQLQPGLSPSWSPNGNQLVFIDGQYRLFLMAADGSHVRQLTDPRVYDSYPSFAPGGHRVLFSRVGNASVRVMTIRTDGTDLRALTPGAVAAWSPNGKQIAFDSPKGGIWAMRPGGEDKHELTSNPGDRLSGYSPDGRHITFVRVLDDYNEVTLIARSDGTHVRRLPCLRTPRFNAIDVTYSPDGEWFLGSMPVPAGPDPRVTTNTVIRFPVQACINGTMRQQRIVGRTVALSGWQPLPGG